MKPQRPVRAVVSPGAGPKHAVADYARFLAASWRVEVRGLNTLAATICTPLSAPVIAATRLRGENVAPARGHLTLHIPEGWHREREWLNLRESRPQAAPGSGLTSPDLVRTRTPPPAADPATTDKPHKGRAAGRPRPHPLTETGREARAIQKSAGGSRLSATSR
jgi:hypothetical protein